jgi:hypothetical protein
MRPRSLEQGLSGRFFRVEHLSFRVSVPLDDGG